MTLWTPALDRHIAILAEHRIWPPPIAASPPPRTKTRRSRAVFGASSCRDQDGKRRHDARTNGSAGSVADSAGVSGAKGESACSNDDMVFAAVVIMAPTASRDGSGSASSPTIS